MKLIMEELRYKLKTAPIFNPVSLDAFKRNLHIGVQGEPDTTQDLYLQEILDRTVEDVQEHIGRQIARATYYGYLDDFPSEDLKITRGPVAAIVAIKYYDLNNSQQTMAAADYLLDNIETTARVRFLNTYNVYSERLNGVEIEFTCGYESAAAVPKRLEEAIILLATDKYMNPENPVLNFGMGLRQTRAENMLRQFRVQRY